MLDFSTIGQPQSSVQGCTPLKQKMIKQLTKIHLQQYFAIDKENETGHEIKMENVEKQLMRIRYVIGQLQSCEQQGDDALSTAASLLTELSVPCHEDVQGWCVSVFEDRYARHASIPNHISIERLRAPIAREKFNTVEERFELLQTYGFRFERFNELLHMIGFWERVGPLLEKLPQEHGGVNPGEVTWQDVQLRVDHPCFAVLVNALNGSSQIDYEQVFHEARDLFDELKSRKLSLSLSEITEKRGTGRSPLSVPDVLMILTLQRLNARLAPEEYQHANGLSLATIDESTARISNDERVRIYHELQKLYEEKDVDMEFVSLINAAARDLELPCHHEGYLANLEDVYREWEELDVVIPLHHFDDGLCSYWARSVMSCRPGTFFIPSGAHLPHKAKRNYGSLPKYSEADETIAALLREDYCYQYKFPGLPALGEYPPVSPCDILSPDDRSVDTSGNAANVAARLEQLQRVRCGPPLKAVILTTDFHSARAWKEFRRQLPPKLVDGLKVAMYRNAPPLADVGHQRRVVGIADLFCEYIKRLYSVAVDPVVK